MIRVISLNLFALFVAACVLYIVPPFTVEIQGKRYFYDSLANPFNAKSNVLNITSYSVSDGYEYIIKSVSVPDSISDINKVVSEDIKILEQRLQNYVGNNFEISNDVRNNEVRHTVFLNKKLDDSTSLLTSTNSDFEVKVFKGGQVVQDSDSLSQFESLDLSRWDFGYAELVEIQNYDGTIIYSVRMPLSLFITPEKVKTIQNNINSQLNVIVAGTENRAYFDYNRNLVPTALVVAGIPNRTGAILIRAFLNTPPTNLAYELESVTFVNVGWHRALIAYGLIIFAIVFSIIINYFWLKKINKSKLFMVLGLIAISLASLKFFDQTLSLTTALLLSIPVIFTIFSVRIVYFILFTASIFLIKLITLLNGFDLTMLSMILIVVFTFFLYLINYKVLHDKDVNIK